MTAPSSPPATPNAVDFRIVKAHEFMRHFLISCLYTGALLVVPILAFYFGLRDQGAAFALGIGLIFAFGNPIGWLAVIRTVRHVKQYSNIRAVGQAEADNRAPVFISAAWEAPATSTPSA